MYDSNKCLKQCPQGQPCTCTNKPHVLHICDDEYCACHSLKRYQGKGVRYARK